MKIYRIKTEEFIYVKAIVFETNPFSIGMIPTIDITEAGWWEEDKAQKYCDDLNNNELYKEANIKFELEEVFNANITD